MVAGGRSIARLVDAIRVGEGRFDAEAIQRKQGFYCATVIKDAMPSNMSVAERRTGA